MSNYPNSGIGDGCITGAELSLYNSGTGGRTPQYARNGFEAPALQNVDVRLARTFTLAEKLKVDIFAEAFNVTNSQLPLSVISNSSSYTANIAKGAKGYNAACDASAHSNACIYPYSPSNSTQSFGAVSSTSGTLYGPRQMQFSAKFIF